MLDRHMLLEWQPADVRHTYTARDTMLYALGVGYGADPLDARQLRFVYEKELVAVPAMACVLASPGFWMRDVPQLGIDYRKVVHGEQSVVMHAPLPAAGAVTGRTRVTRVVDKGIGKGAVLHVEKLLMDDAGQHLATVEQVLFCRGDGGFAKLPTDSDTPAPTPRATPEREPDRQADLATRPDAALLYRLNGDINPLHVEPALAAQAGFARPILHGLATFGIACRGLMALYAEDEPGRVQSMRARLSAPVYPGETIRLESWREEADIAFRAVVVERGVTVLSHGRVEVRHD